MSINLGNPIFYYEDVFSKETKIETKKCMGLFLVLNITEDPEYKFGVA
jgi:hypothetical protein